MCPRFTYCCYVLLIPLLNVPITVRGLERGTQNLPRFQQVCPSSVYCQGILLEKLHSAQVYETSKTFVDMEMKRDETAVLDDFDAFLNEHNGNVSKRMLMDFVSQNFQTDNSLDKWTPPDFKHYPAIVGYVRDERYKELLAGVNQIWKDLARKISVRVNEYKTRHSMIYVPNGFFLNMEKQNEFNYWDTYWIIRGALICGMETTVKGILENLLCLVEEYGYVPTGNRIYYDGRSQPPLLVQMMATYYTFTKDKSFIVDNLSLLDTEMMFWLERRAIHVENNGNTYVMVHFMSETFNPRPEMYTFDKNLASMLKSIKDKNQFQCRVKAAFESGWGFSSKHFHNRLIYDDYKKILLKTNPLNFVYVELNSIMQSNANVLSEMFLLKNDVVNSTFYKQIARHFQIGINALLWNEEENIWLDFDVSTKKSRNNFYASNLAPLWTGSYDEKLSEFYGDAAVDYLIRNNIINDDLTPRFLCIPTSLYDSGLDWDHHNCWPQLQSMVIFGLQSTKSKRAQRVALNFASSWVHVNHVAYNKTQTLFEKYNAISLVDVGYDVPAPKGYGVTIGLLFEIFHAWGDILVSSDP